MSEDGALPRRLGPVALGAAVFNTVVGAGIFVTPAALAHDLGPAAPAAYLACVVAMGAVSLCFAAAGSRVPTAGGPSGYVRAAFGPAAGFVVGVLVWLSSVLAGGGIASAVADNLARAWPALKTPVLRALLIAAIFAALAAVNAAGAKPGARLVGLLTLVKLAPLLLLVVLSLGRLKGGDLAFQAPEPGALGRAMILALFAFQGMETALGVSGEVRDPARNVPLGLLGAMGTVALLYTGVQVAAQGVLGPALARSHTPLVDAAAAIAPWLGGVVLAGASVSMLGYLAGDVLSAPRLLYSFASEGLAPRALAGLGARSRAPYAAVWTHAAIAAALAITGGFTELAVLSSLATVVVYALACGAAVRLQAKDVVRAGPPLRPPGLGVAAGVGILSMGWIALHAAPAEAAGSAGAVALALLWYAVARRAVRPSRPGAAP